MQPTNQNQNVQQNTNNNQPTQNQSQKVSEDQASDFSKKMKKKEDPKSAKGESKDDQSLESLMAERRKSAKEALEGKFKDQGGREGQKGQEEGAMQSLLDGNEHAIGQVRETQQASEAQLKSIQAVSGPKEINEVINKLVDKIMVSSKDAIEGAEVRITLKDNILPGTEIRIQRVSGELQVTMNTSNADSHNFLVANEASLMKNLEKLGEKVQVNINMSGGGGEQNDGRSQQEYVGEEEQEEDDS
ncbi:type III secretion HpaP family protein [Endozoicomonas arenosclerae]|uniref:type III secretion HpaP family protein n=1 Tax=Endozoicomonas arenosclerae TaxID=1633495 RepID=UPI00078634E1|nr:type III secretion HpaP family protein [Endozoicomonas arenosclerae]